MLYALFTIVLTSVLIILFKFFDKQKVNTIIAVVINYIFATFFSYLQFDGSFSVTEAFKIKGLTMAMVTGVLFTTGFTLFAISTKRAGITLTAVASRMSILIPIMFGVWLFNDSLTIIKILGILLTILSFFLIFKSNGNKIAESKRNNLFPVFVFFTTGSIDSITNAYEKMYHPSPNELANYLFIVFLMAFCTGAILISIKYQFKEIKHSLLKNTVAGFIIGALNFAATYCFMKGVSVLPTSIFIPTINIGIVVMTSIAGYLFFKEILNKINIIGIAMAIVAILLLTGAIQ